MSAMKEVNHDCAKSRRCHSNQSDDANVERVYRMCDIEPANAELDYCSVQCGMLIAVLWEESERQIEKDEGSAEPAEKISDRDCMKQQCALGHPPYPIRLNAVVIFPGNGPRRRQDDISAHISHCGQQSS